MNEEQLKQMIDACFAAPEEQKTSFLNDLTAMLDTHRILPVDPQQTISDLSLEQQIILEIVKRQDIEHFRSTSPVILYNYAREMTRLILTNPSEE